MTEHHVHEYVRDSKPLLVEASLTENPKLALDKDDDDRTPLHWACSVNNENMVDLLLRFATNFDLDDLTDASGWTPLHIAASVGNSSIVSKLLLLEPQPDVNLATNQGTTPLHLAISKGHLTVVRELVEVYQCSVRTKDKKGMTPLIRAACIGHGAMVLILGRKSHVNASDKNGWTALHHALAEGHGDVAVQLVGLGADVAVVNSDGETPEQVAVDDNVRQYFKSHTG